MAKKNERDKEKFDFRCDKSKTVQPMHMYIEKEKTLCYFSIHTSTSSIE